MIALQRSQLYSERMEVKISKKGFYIYVSEIIFKEASHKV